MFKRGRFINHSANKNAATAPTAYPTTTGLLSDASNCEMHQVVVRHVLSLCERVGVMSGSIQCLALVCHQTPHLLLRVDQKLIEIELLCLHDSATACNSVWHVSLRHDQLCGAAGLLLMLFTQMCIEVKQLLHQHCGATGVWLILLWCSGAEPHR